ncbi:hypothetical protein NQZ68_037154 [Dissostichus eleginoides]|nr:hypothetical protein NQZ68_037154 [Dissostichus eleginoides]
MTLKRLFQRDHNSCKETQIDCETGQNNHKEKKMTADTQPGAPFADRQGRQLLGAPDQKGACLVVLVLDVLGGMSLLPGAPRVSCSTTAHNYIEI